MHRAPPVTLMLRSTLALVCVWAACAARPAVASPVRSDRIARVYVDGASHLHMVPAGGRDTRVGGGRRYRDPHVAPDQWTFGALVLDRDSRVLAERVEIRRSKHVLRTVAPGGFIRAWGFWNDGREVVVYTGGLHFAGWYLLTDLASGREVGTSEDPVTERSPAWVRSLP